MNSFSRPLPKPARAIADAARGAVSGAQSKDPDRFRRAAEGLAALDPERTGRVLGAVVRSLLEYLHPDGLTADDVRALVERCRRSAAGWCPDVDPQVLVLLVAGALGVHQSDAEAFPLDGHGVARHAPLLVADLIAASGLALDTCLDAAFADLALAETAEMP